MIFSYLCGYLMEGFLFITKNQYILAMILFMLANMLICYPFTRWGKKKSAAYAKLKPEVDRIKNSGGDVHQVEKELSDLYEKNNISFLNVVAQPLSTLVDLFMITGFLGAIMNPFKFILHLPLEDISLLTESFKTANQSAILSALCEDMSLLPAISLDGALKVSNYVEALNSPGFYNLATVPTAKVLLWLPLVAIGLRVLQMGLTFLYSWLLTKQVKKSQVIMQLVFFAMFLTISFSVPSVLCIYWILGTVLGLVKIICNLIKLAKKKSEDKSKT